MLRKNKTTRVLWRKAIAGLVLAWALGPVLWQCGAPQDEWHRQVFTDSTPQYSLRAEFPVFAGYPQANKAVQQKILEEIASFERNAIAYCARDNAIPYGQTRMEAFAEVLACGPGLLSVRWVVYADWQSSDMTSKYFATWNYNPRKGKQITLADYAARHFGSDSAAARYFTQAVAQKLVPRSGAYCAGIWRNRHPLHDFADFYLRPGRIQFIFDDYILETETCGTPEVVIAAPPTK